LEVDTMFRLRTSLLACAFAFSAASAAHAATATGSFAVTMTITSQCAISTPTTLAFGSSGLLSAVVNQTSTFNVTCTNTTGYTVGLDNGANASASQRRMKGGAGTEYINYNLYSDSGRATPWGNASGSWVSGTGNGQAQTLTVYGQVPVQTVTPSPAANYTDTVNITVTY
jgi:spore coat protein U-like protein